MSKHALFLAAALAVAPGLALAQMADPNHPAPGEGHRIPAVQRTSQQPLAAYQANPSIPGDGYRMVVERRTNSRPLSAYQTLPWLPGDGYRMK
ncbi:MAG TPA: hypothetical protein VGB82_16190 [Alphaproteobacteria bacterium]